MESTILVGGAAVWAHSPDKCEGQPCCIHNPSQHHMVKWKQNWRDDTGVMERICPHGVGHPDPDHLAHKRQVGLASAPGKNPQARAYHKENWEYDAIHGCDGCCKPAQAVGETK